MQVEKNGEWVQNDDFTYLEKPNCSTNGRPVSIISCTYKLKKEENKELHMSLWTIGYPSQFDIIEVLLWNQELHCFQVLYKVTIANCFKKTLQYEPLVFLLPIKHSSQLSTVLHWVVFCVGWIHSCLVHFLWEFPGCWNVMLARKGKLLHHHCPCRIV